LSTHTNHEEPYRWLSVRLVLWRRPTSSRARAQGVVPAHAHHAIQIVIALDGSVAIGGSERWMA